MNFRAFLPLHHSFSFLDMILEGSFNFWPSWPPWICSWCIIILYRHFIRGCNWLVKLTVHVLIIYRATYCEFLWTLLIMSICTHMHTYTYNSCVSLCTQKLHTIYRLLVTTYAWYIATYIYILIKRLIINFMAIMIIIIMYSTTILYATNIDDLQLLLLNSAGILKLRLKYY